jgi:hypothetical protein
MSGNPCIVKLWLGKKQKFLVRVPEIQTQKTQGGGGSGLMCCTDSFKNAAASGRAINSSPRTDA